MAGVRLKLWPTLAFIAAATIWLASGNAPTTAQTGVLPSSIREQPTIAANVTEDPVAEVRVSGNRQVPTGKILQIVATRVGRPFDQSAFESDVRKLALKGWFLDVKPLKEKTPAGIVVTFQVVERPTLDYVKYVGNVAMDKKTLNKKSELKVGAALDPYAVEDGRRKLEAWYKEKGYNNVQITVLEGTKTTDKGAAYLINEGICQKVWKVKFEGNTIASDARLKTQIGSKPPLLYIWKGFVEKKKVDEDIEKLTAYYRSLGFFRARIGREIEFDENDKWATLTFVIDEGPRYVVRNVSFIGNTKYDEKQLSEELAIKSGEFFDQGKMNRDIGMVRDVYGSQGYIFTNVEADPRFLEEPGQIDLVYNIEEGDRYRVGRINVHIEGENAHTRHNTVLNRISLRPGDIVDIRELRASERRLRASGLFLNDPTKGAAPKIVFSPPELEGDKPSVASGKGNFRGQSPDVTEKRIDLNESLLQKATTFGSHCIDVAELNFHRKLEAYATATKAAAAKSQNVQNPADTNIRRTPR